MRRLLICTLVSLLAGCTKQAPTWYREYVSVGDRWAESYAGADAVGAYEETLRFTEYVKQMQRDGRPFDRIPDVLIWNYARLGLLAEHLGKEEEAARYFATAVRYAQKTYPEESESKKTEAAFRAALEEMDTPENCAWRKRPNQALQPTPVLVTPRADARVAPSTGVADL